MSAALPHPITIHFTLNKQATRVTVAPTDRLSAVLRDTLNIQGTKVGCDAGDCGACTVLIDDEPACACLVSASQIHDCHITTVEGLGNDTALSALQQAFLHHGAAQCGICTPGMLVSASALLKHTAKPSSQQVEDALGGVLCRCTGYKKIVDAVMAAHTYTDAVADAVHVDGDTAMHLPSAALQASNVGQSIARIDGQPKVTGVDQFGADGIPGDAVYVKVIRSPHHHARFTIGDIKEFMRTHPGVLCVLTAKDIPGTNSFGVIPGFEDQPVFAQHTSYYRGEAIAAVVAEAQTIKQLDTEQFPVDYEPLDAILDASEALQTNAAQLHTDYPGNVLVRGRVERGDVAAGFQQATHTVEASFTTPFIEHAYIEPEAGYAQRTGNRLEIFASTQAPQMDREQLALIMGLDQVDVRIVPTACGGGFGSKIDISMQPYIALAAWAIKRPAAIVYSRRESMQSTTKRHPSSIALKVGCDNAGTITAMDFSGEFNTGAFASWGPTVANRVPVHASGPYFTPNYRANTVAALTHCHPSGAFRGFGVPQSAVAQESVYDELADRVGMDRLAFRLHNALQPGSTTVTGETVDDSVGIHACLQALKPAWERAIETARVANAKAGHWRRGVGVASCWYGCGNTGLSNPSTIRIGLTRNASVVLHQGATDIGQGANTVIAQIAAHALGVPVHVLQLVNGDTDITPDAGKTSASRQTYISGRAALASGTLLRALIIDHAKATDRAQLVFDQHALSVHEPDGTTIPVDLNALPIDDLGYVFCAQETYDPPTVALDANGQGKPYAVWGYGAQLIELSVDVRLGQVKLHRLTAAHDVGKAVNPQLVEGQIEGGAAQGIGMALMEDYIPGRSENLHDYLIPTIGDIPDVESIIVEVPDADGPYGAKGLGEHVLVPTAPAILNAIKHATGVRIYDLPATPSRVRGALCATLADTPPTTRTS